MKTLDDLTVDEIRGMIDLARKNKLDGYMMERARAKRRRKGQKRLLDDLRRAKR